jgi:disulfide bond formation protein DsbB
MNTVKQKIIIKSILLFSIFAILAAYFIQFVLGHQPCNLCLIERVPYIVSIIVISLFLFFKKFEKIFLIVLSLVFICASLISFYHFGIEQGFIKESLVCDLNSININLTKESLLNELKEIKVSCKDVTFKIFGLSLATINIFISLIISVIIIKLFLSYEKNKSK